MVQMSKIKKEGNVVSLLCIPQGKFAEHFETSFDITTREILSINDVGESVGDMLNYYAGHAISKLRKTWEEEQDLPEEEISMWY